MAASLAVALIVRGFLIQAFYIPSESMVPTLVKNDRVLVNKLSYKLHDVHRGDIVVFKAPPGAATAQVKDLIKRVVGLPGETIEGRNGSIFINGKPLDEPYLPPDVRSRDFPPEKIPPDKIYVLGDNRQDSRDSTFFHAIDESAIVGRAFVKIWPLSDLGPPLATPLADGGHHPLDVVAVDPVDPHLEDGPDPAVLLGVPGEGQQVEAVGQGDEPQ